MATSAVQRRTLLTLVTSQVLGGVGVASGIAVTALVAREVSGSDTLAGLGTTAQVIGGALFALPMARLMSRRGRRPGLMFGYLAAIVGAALVVAAAVVRSFPLLLLGTGLFGGATAANSQSRYAAADLAEPAHRGRDLSLVVWATTIGSVLGPNLVGPAEPVTEALHLPALTGSYVFSVAGFALAATVLFLRLRPDPLLVARGRAPDPVASAHVPTGPARGSARHGWEVIRERREALVGLAVLAGGHAVMVGVMVMTPLHMDHGGAQLRLIGLVISIHILGMYALSPLMGLLVDRYGGRPGALGGALVLLGSCLLAAGAPAGMSTGLAVALFLLGVGWSGTLVSGSTMLTQAVPTADRPATQGFADLCMGLAGGAAGLGSGAVLDRGGYAALALVGALVALALLAVVVLARPGGRSATTGAG